MAEKTKLSTDAYKGVRDFYPEDMFIQNYIFGVWKKTVEQFGYQEYNASVLEPTELYKAKSGEEIVNEQTYSFKDRGDRDVTLRPEMTPTVARLVAAKRRELGFPLRWYSIPNLFRYEQPQRGRLREHWQLNVDIFGVESSDAEVEGITVASKIMKNFGASETDFEIRINSRKIINFILTDIFKLDEAAAHRLSKLIDRKEKMPAADFEAQSQQILGEQTKLFLNIISSKSGDDLEKITGKQRSEIPGLDDLHSAMKKLNASGVKNVVFSPTLMRGFDYYTGIVFEIFDTNPENRRALFGGGRYDDLLAIFGNERVPAFGFGMGDVTIRDFLETHALLPKYQPSTQLYLCSFDEKSLAFSVSLADRLRESGINVAMDLSGKKISDQIKSAGKQKIPFIAVIGEDEMKTGIFKIKNMDSGEEKAVNENEIKAVIHTKK